MTGDNGIVLLCTLHPANTEKQNKVLDLLRNGARDYYRRPTSKCTTWSYFTPLAAPKADSKSVIGGLEIYTDKSALQDQVSDKAFFQAYHEKVKREKLYARDEELVAYYFAGGFVAREQHASPFGSGTLISLTKFVCKDRQVVMEILEGFVSFVREKEPGVLTYLACTRPKAPKEIMLFVRYRDREALKGHAEAREHVDVVERTAKNIENDVGTSTSMWKEVDDSFVSTKVGGPDGSSKL